MRHFVICGGPNYGGRGGRGDEQMSHWRTRATFQISAYFPAKRELCHLSQLQDLGEGLSSMEPPPRRAHSPDHDDERSQTRLRSNSVSKKEDVHLACSHLGRRSRSSATTFLNSFHELERLHPTGSPKFHITPGKTCLLDILGH